MEHKLLQNFTTGWLLFIQRTAFTKILVPGKVKSVSGSSTIIGLVQGLLLTIKLWLASTNPHFVISFFVPSVLGVVARNR